MKRKSIWLVSALLLFLFVRGETHTVKGRPTIKAHLPAKPSIHYKLTIERGDQSSLYVEMEIRSIPGIFRLAMMAHPEYDDRYWRYIENLQVEAERGKAAIIREDSALCRVTAEDGNVMVRYQVHLPPKPQQQRAAWRPFISANGALAGGAHTFLYLPEYESLPVTISIQVPTGWSIATPLNLVKKPNDYDAPSAAALLDAPILAGQLASWEFKVTGTNFHVIYWPLDAAKNFNTTTWVGNIEKMTQQAARLFGKLPFHDYWFFVQDSSYGALEHLNSVTVGVPADEILNNKPDYLKEITHEFFHAWNLMRIHPAGYGELQYKKPALSRGLWFSEGLTMYYADLLLRRAGLPMNDTSRIIHLENLLQRYFGSKGNYLFSAEEVSMASYGTEDMLGDYMASTHLQGELLGNLMDIITRNASEGKKSMDDVMRIMMEKFSGRQGFTSEDIRQVLEGVCHCDQMALFHESIAGNKPPDFGKYLGLLGLQYDLKWKDAVSENGDRYADLRIYTWMAQNEDLLRIKITDPESCWGKAGLHTGDILISANGHRMASSRDFWEILRQVKIGDSLLLEIQRNEGNQKIKVIVEGYKRPVVSIFQVPSASVKQEKLLRQWLDGN